MRVVHLPSSYLPDTIGGTETFVSTLAETLKDKGVESRVVVHSDVPTQSSDPCELVRLAPIDEHTSRVGLYSKFLNRNPPGFLQFLRQWKPDLVHFHAFSLGASLDHARVLRNLQIPYVITYHTPAQSCPRGTLLHLGKSPCDGELQSSKCASCVLQSQNWPLPLAKLAAKSRLSARLFDGTLVTRIAMPSLLREARQSTLEYFHHSSAVVACAEFCKAVLTANGVDAGKIKVIRQALPGPTRNRILRPVGGNRVLHLGFFGRVTRIKGVDLAVECLNHLRERGVHAKLQIVGPINPSESQWFTKLLNSEPQAAHLGTFSGAQLKDWLHTLDLVLIPSRWLETGPLTLLEAWDQSTLVLGTNQAGIREFMAANNLSQCLFEPESPAAIAGAIIEAQYYSEFSVSIPGSQEQGTQYKLLYDSVIN